MQQTGSARPAREMLAALTALAALVAGCVGPLQAVAPDRLRHDAAVRDLEQRVADEDGWTVLPLPIINEGGGLATWWLHPCDPAVDLERDVTRTVFQGSDVQTLPDSYTVEQDTTACELPSQQVALAAGRTVTLDVPVLALGWGHALVEDRDAVVVVDGAGGHAVAVEAGAQPVTGPCDGRTTWVADLESGRQLHLRVDSCVATIDALPPLARTLVTRFQGDPQVGQLPADQVPAFAAALADAGWDADEIVVRDFDSTGVAPYWLGPCGPALDGEGQTRPEVDWFADELTVFERTCD